MAPDRKEHGAGTASQMDTLAVYVHWPFCLSRCPYCDFNAHVRETIDQARWHDAYLTEIAHVAATLPGRVVTSVFLAAARRR